MLTSDIIFQVSYQTYYPTNPIKGIKTINFLLSAWTSQTFYLLNEALLSIKVKLCQANGQALPDASVAAPINNILGSIFQVLYFIIILTNPF
jgi:hypothetical protein